MARVKLARRITRFHGRLRPFLPRGHRLYRVAGGRIYLDVRESPMMLARALRAYEPDKFDLIGRILSEDSNFLDVGANKGDFTLFAARLAPKGRVLAFEPEAANCSWIRRSVAANGYRNVELFELALSDTDGEATLHLGRYSGWHSLVGPEAQSQGGERQVITRRLDTVLRDAGLRDVDVVKIDVEGAELKVLDGARETLARNRRLVVLVDIHPTRGVTPDDVFRLLQEHGYEVRDIRRPLEALTSPGEQSKEIVAARPERFLELFAD